jgi:hypothetical protein
MSYLFLISFLIARFGAARTIDWRRAGAFAGSLGIADKGLAAIETVGAVGAVGTAPKSPASPAGGWFGIVFKSPVRPDLMPPSIPGM